MAGINGTTQKNLTAEQIQTLRDEISKPAYAGLKSNQIVNALNNRAWVANPNAQGTISAPAPNIDEVISRLDADKYLVIVADPIGQAILGAISTLTTVDLSSTLAAGLMQKLVTESLLTQAELNQLLAPAQIPDPAWQAQIQQPGSSIVEQLPGFGVGWTVEGADVRPLLS